MPPDNKAMFTRCCKRAKCEPALDLLPRVRYTIGVTSPVGSQWPSAKLLLEPGLHIVPITDASDESISRIVAINLSDKIIRIYNGMLLGDASDRGLPTRTRPRIANSSPTAGRALPCGH